MKIFKNLTFSILFPFIIFDTFGQTPNIFENTDILKSYLDERTYVIPEYGSIKFEYNNSETRNLREKRIRDGADDEVVDLVFDISVKRIQARRRQKIDYKVKLKIDLRDPQNVNTDPTSEYFEHIFLARNEVYFIKGFPAHFILFADGELYYPKVTWKKITFNDFKSIVTSDQKGDIFTLPTISKDYATTTYVKCPTNL